MAIRHKQMRRERETKSWAVSKHFLGYCFVKKIIKSYFCNLCNLKKNFRGTNFHDSANLILFRGV